MRLKPLQGVRLTLPSKAAKVPYLTLLQVLQVNFWSSFPKLSAPTRWIDKY
tara:strand:+ start:482 stop:634 length:153 start_codon:yes stop_codon:yes gene_type:complete